MSRISRGVQAGLLAGVFVAAFFFVADVIRLAPLATPIALSRVYLPAGLQLESPELWHIASVLGFAVRLLALTALHLLVFALLGAGAVALFDRLHWRLNAGTGALYGLVVYSLAFYGAVTLGNRGVLDGVPAIWSLATANFFAGAITGRFLQRFPAAAPGRI